MTDVTDACSLVAPLTHRKDLPCAPSPPGPRAGRRLAVAAASPSARSSPRSSYRPGRSPGSTGGDRPDGYKKAYAAAAKTQRSAAQGSGTIFPADGTTCTPRAASTATGTTTTTRARRTPSPEPRRPPTAETADPTTPQQARLAVGAAEVQRSQSEPKLSNVPVSATHTSSPTDRYNMFNACYGIQSSRTGRWLDRRQRPHLHRVLDRRRRPALLQAHRARPLPALQPREDLPRRRQPAARTPPTPGPSNDWVVHDAAAGAVHLPDPRQGLPDRHRLQRHDHRAPARCCGCACAAAAPTSPRSAPTSPATRSPA